MDSDLPVAEIGVWSLEKHQRLKKYVDILRAVRRKFTDQSRQEKYRGGATYIDLFCGPGRAIVRETRAVVDGSPLVAVKSALASNAPFSEVHLADLQPAYSNAATTRVANLGGNVVSYTGTAEETARKIVAQLNPYGFHFAFLDPYNLGNLSFDVIRTLAAVERIDLLMHISVQDMQRNSDRYTAEEFDTFDRFAPGWRSTVNLNQSLQAIRAAILSYWRDLVRNLGFDTTGSVELVRGSNNQRLYWLAFASRHERGNEFWDKTRNISGQSEFGF
jgi:three-Cys-motif partner protein